jgi:RNA polymerase sigma factor (sigma-70 family)
MTATHSDLHPVAASVDGESAERRRAAWMDRAQRGDRAAYEQLLREAIALVRRVARQASVADDRVDDIVQETFLTVHRVLHTYDPSRSFDAWLCAIARRRIVDGWRRDGRTHSREVHDPVHFESFADDGADPAREHDRHCHARALDEAIDSLPPAQREAVEHLAWGEQPAADAARLTGRSANSMKVNLHRALKSLRRRLTCAESP